MTVSGKLLTSGEHEVFSVHTHVKALFAPVLVLLLTSLAGGYGWGAVQLGERVLGSAIVGIALLVVLTWSVAPFLRWLTTTYSATNRRLIEQSGVFSRSGRIIPLSRVNDVSFEKNLSDRLLGCGTLVVRANSELDGLRLHDVPRVEEVHRSLTELVLGAQHAPDDDSGASGLRSGHSHA